ncbi:hypothetical protein BHE74_00011477 [Ensete ventricosum]|nr:hypothetical protein BHE74_00011477 [Ensete ventricosum]
MGGLPTYPGRFSRPVSKDNEVGNSFGIRQGAEGIGSLPGWRKGIHQKKNETHKKIIEGSRKAYRDGCTVVA